MRRIILAAAIAGAASTMAQAAQPGKLAGNALRSAISGKTVYLRTQGIELPISYRSNGTMTGRLQAFSAAAAGGGPTDRGRWWITNDSLCQRWSKWLEGRSYCYKLRQDGQIVYWQRDDGRQGTARFGS